tara:strand:+ start:1715 stop:2281 length:567 start_codon:yes stop_codon:yes gene_type:complete
LVFKQNNKDYFCCTSANYTTLKTTNSLNIKNLVFPVAIVFALARILLDLGLKLIETSAIPYYSSFIIAAVFEIIAIVYLIKKFKKSNEEQLSLSEALIVGVMFMVIVGTLFALQSFLYDTYIDPEFQKNAALEFANLYGKGADVEKMMIGEENIQATSSIFSIFTSILKFSLLGILISFIVGSILRNR